MNQLSRLLAAWILLTAGGTMAIAGPNPAQKCAAAKKQAAGKKAKCKTGCDAKAVNKALPFTDQTIMECNGKCTDTFSDKWDKIEEKRGCVTTSDKGTIEAKVDTLQVDLRTALGGGAVSQCTASVYKEAGKKAACKLNCHAKAQKKGLPISDQSVQDCLAKCGSKFADPVKGKCPKAVAAGGCLMAVNCGSIETMIDTFVDDVASELPTGTTTTTTTSTTTTTACAEGSPCGPDVCGACAYVECATSGSRTCTPQVCSGGTCGDGTPFSDPCTRGSQDGQACTGGICGAGSCCTGCFSISGCVAGTSQHACGLGGSLCDDCGPILGGLLCINGLCQ